MLESFDTVINNHEGELFRDKNTKHILLYRHDEGLVHYESLFKEITGCIDFQQNN